MTADFKSRIKKDFLPFVIKPGRYIGNEWGVIKKDSPAKFKLALVYPDIYDRAVSDTSLNFLYYAINGNPNWSAERVFLPAKDAEKRLREERISLFSLENFSPLKKFDLILFGLKDQLGFTSILNMLDLAQMPLYTRERVGRHPLVAGYGKAALNPEPMADFFDFLILGEEADNIKEILIKFESFKREKMSKEELLVSLSQIKSIYVPAFYEVANCNQSPKPKSEEFPYPISVKMTETARFYSEKRMVPLVETEREGLEIEVSGANMPTEDFTENDRSLDEIIKNIQVGLNNTGEDEVRIRVGPAYQNFPHLVKTLWEKFGSQRATFFFPDLNPILLTPEVIRLLAEQKRNNISFSTLAISERLRDFLHQKITGPKLIEIIDNISQYPFKSLRLSFFLGVPNESKEDLDKLEKFLSDVNKIQRKSANAVNLLVDFKVFLPLPHTPWQWDKLEDLEKLKEDISYLKLNLNFRNMRFVFPDLEKAYLKGVLARGDRRLGSVIHKVWQKEIKSAAEENIFNFSLWENALAENSLKFEDYTKAKNFEEELAWKHIQLVNKLKLKQARLNADERLRIPVETCSTLVAKSDDKLKNSAEDLYGRKRKIVQKKTATSLVKSKVRLKWSKAEEVRFTSHLDALRTFDKSFRRAKIPIEYSLGFHPHQRVSFGPPLPIGFISEAEYLDMQLETPFREEFLAKLNSSLPDGFKFLEAKTVLGKTVSLSESINLAGYAVELPYPQDTIQTQINSLLEKKSLIVTRVKKDSNAELDIRPYIVALEAEKISPEKTNLKMQLILTPLGYARPQEVLSYGWGLAEKEILRLLIKRTGLYCKKDEQLLSPMELVY